MEPDLLSVPSLSACPRCGAGTRAGAPWCTQCFLDLRTPPAPPASPPAPEPAPLALLVQQVDPLTAPLHQVTDAPAPGVPPARAWPCTGCGTGNGFELSACAGCGLGFLAGAGGAPPSLHVPGVGDLGAMSKGKRMGLALAAALSLMLLVLVLGLLLG